MLRHTAVLTSLVVLLLRVHQVVRAEDTFDRFRAVYSSVVHQHDESFRKGLTIVAAVTFPEIKKPTPKTLYFSGLKHRVEVDLGKVSVVSCVGDRMTFSLFQKEERNDLIHLSYNGDPSIEDDELDQALLLCRPHYYVHGFSLLSVISSPEFRVVKCEKTRADEVELVNLEFEWKRVDRLSRESVLLEPDRNWAIKKHVMSLRSGESYVTEVAYSANGFLPRQSMVTVDGNLDRKVDFFEWKEGALPDEPFSPGFYGIPEYSGMRVVWTYAIGTGLLCGILFLVWKWKRS